MNARKNIIDTVLSDCPEQTIADVRIGLGYTAVMLDNGRVGVAYTFHRDIQGGCDVFKGKGSLIGRKAPDLVSLLSSSDKIETALALATVNALINTKNESETTGDVLEQIDFDPNDHVGMVGNFAPILGMLKKKCAKLSIFEKIDFPTGNILPEKEIPHILPDCHVAIISSTTLINGTLDNILGSTSGCRQVIMLGASTPLLPEAFTATPVTLLSGVVVMDPSKILAIVSQGGGMRAFKHCITKVNRHVPA